MIPSGSTCNVDISSAVADSFELSTGGSNFLNILTGSKLTVDGSSSAVSGTATHEVSSGTVELQGSGQLEFAGSVNHTVTGSGRIEGKSNSATITVATVSQTLTNAITTTGIVGHLQIDGPGNFTNQGRVEARENGSVSGEELVILITGTLDDTSAGSWRTRNHPDAKLVFDSTMGPIAALDGDFIILDGRIVIEKAFETEGQLDMVSGVLDVQANVTMGSAGNRLDMTGGEIQVDAGALFTHE